MQTKLLLLAILFAPLPAGASDNSHIQAPPAQTPPQTITILRPAWFGPYRVRGRIIPVQPLAPGIYREIRPRVPVWLDPLGVFNRRTSSVIPADTHEWFVSEPNGTWKPTLHGPYAIRSDAVAKCQSLGGECELQHVVTRVDEVPEVTVEKWEAAQ